MCWRVDTNPPARLGRGWVLPHLSVSTCVQDDPGPPPGYRRPKDRLGVVVQGAHRQGFRAWWRLSPTSPGHPRMRSPGRQCPSSAMTSELNLGCEPRTALHCGAGLGGGSPCLLHTVGKGPGAPTVKMAAMGVFQARGDRRLALCAGPPLSVTQGSGGRAGHLSLVPNRLSAQKAAVCSSRGASRP